MRKFTVAHFTFSLFLSLILVSCAPTIHYLGESQQPSSEIDVFYDEGDVKREYKVMGKMTNDQFVAYDIELIKAKMVEKAKKAGGDAIIFTDLGIANDENSSGSLAVKANVIKYLN